MILSYPQWLDRAKVSVGVLATKYKSKEWMLPYQIKRSMQRMLMLFRRSWYYMVYMVHCYLSHHFFVLGNDPQRAHKCSESIFLLPAITSLKQQSNHKEYHSAFPVGSTAQWLSLCSEKVLLKQGRCSLRSKRFPPPPPPSFIFFLLSFQFSRRTSRGNACYAGCVIHFFFCSRSNFLDEPREETLATQAKDVAA